MATIQDTKIQNINVFNNPENVLRRHKAAIFALDKYIRDNSSLLSDAFKALLKKEDSKRTEYVLVDFLNAKSLENWIKGHKKVEPTIGDNDIAQFDDCFRNSAVENKTIKDGEYTLYIRTNRMQDSTESADTNPIKVFAKVYLDNFICGPLQTYDQAKYKDSKIFYKITAANRKKGEGSAIKNAADKWLGRYQEWEVKYQITLNTRSSLEKLHELAVVKCGIDTSKYEIIADDFIDAAIKPKETNLLEIRYKANKIVNKDMLTKDLKQELNILRPIIAKYLKTFWMPIKSDILDDDELSSIFDTIGSKIISKSLYAVAPEKAGPEKFNIFFRFIVESNINIDPNKKIVSLVNANSNKSAKTLIENIITNKIRNKIVETLK